MGEATVERFALARRGMPLAIPPQATLRGTWLPPVARNRAAPEPVRASQPPVVDAPESDLGDEPWWMEASERVPIGDSHAGREPGAPQRSTARDDAPERAGAVGDVTPRAATPPTPVTHGEAASPERAGDSPHDAHAAPAADARRGAAGDSRAHEARAPTGPGGAPTPTGAPREMGRPAAPSGAPTEVKGAQPRHIVVTKHVRADSSGIESGGPASPPTPARALASPGAPSAPGGAVSMPPAPNASHDQRISAAEGEVVATAPAVRATATPPDIAAPAVKAAASVAAMGVPDAPVGARSAPPPELATLLAPEPRDEREIHIDRVVVTVRAGAAPAPSAPVAPVQPAAASARASRGYRNPWASYHAWRD